MPIQFTAKLKAFSRSSAGYILKLEMDPSDQWQELGKADLGTVYGIAMVEIVPETGLAKGGDALERQIREQLDTAPPQSPPAAGARRKWSELKRSEQAGVLCADPKFQKWVSDNYYTEPYLDLDTASVVRICCHVKSRSELDSDRYAVEQWDKMVSLYRQATGQETWHP